MKNKKHQQLALRGAICFISENTSNSNLREHVLNELEDMLIIDEITCPNCGLYSISNIYGENYCLCTDCKTSWQVDLKR